MLDHDELLSAEQADPAFVQKLQTIYQMKDAEKQVLARVQERLAQNPQPLLLVESAQAKVQSRALQLISPAIQPAKARKKWLRPLNTLAAVLVMGMLIGALVLTFSATRAVNTTTGSSSVTGGIHLFLEASEQGGVLSKAALDETRTLLEQRFSIFGLKHFSVQEATNNGRSGLAIDLPHFGGDEQQTLDTLAGAGTLAFWSTGKSIVPRGTILNVDYYTQFNPGGKPSFTGQNLDPKSLVLSHDQEGLPEINFEMKGVDIQRFQRYTANNIGNVLTITFDGKVLESALLQSSGPTLISGLFTQQQASAMLADFKSGTLPVGLTPASVRNAQRTKETARFSRLLV